MNTWTQELPIDGPPTIAAHNTGPNAGRPAVFIRLADTAAPAAVRPAADTALTHYTPDIVITGGEPLRWQHTPAWHLLLRSLIERTERPVRIHVETSGSTRPGDPTAFAVAHFTVTPTPTSRRNPTALRTFASLARSGAASLLLTCRTAADVHHAVTHADKHEFPRRHLWITPSEGVDTRALSETAARAGANTTPRLHPSPQQVTSSSTREHHPA